MPHIKKTTSNILVWWTSYCHKPSDDFDITSSHLMNFSPSCIHFGTSTGFSCTTWAVFFVPAMLTPSTHWRKVRIYCHIIPRTSLSVLVLVRPHHKSGSLHEGILENRTRQRSAYVISSSWTSLRPANFALRNITE